MVFLAAHCKHELHVSNKIIPQGLVHNGIWQKHTKAYTNSFYIYIYNIFIVQHKTISKVLEQIPLTGNWRTVKVQWHWREWKNQNSACLAYISPWHGIGSGGMACLFNSRRHVACLHGNDRLCREPVLVMQQTSSTIDALKGCHPTFDAEQLQQSSLAWIRNLIPSEFFWNDEFCIHLYSSSLAWSRVRVLRTQKLMSPSVEHPGLSKVFSLNPRANQNTVVKIRPLLETLSNLRIYWPETHKRLKRTLFKWTKQHKVRFNWT